MYDFHVHVGDGFLLPAEAMRLARVHGYKAVALLVRADGTTLALLLPWLLQVSRHYSLYTGVEAFAGVELVHIPPALMPEAVAEARSLGASLVVAHGETLEGTVECGTNHAAIEAGVDILAHPGLLTHEDAAFAAERGVLLELTTAPVHCLANAHVASMAAEYGCGTVFGSNTKHISHFVSQELRNNALKGARLTQDDLAIHKACQEELLQRLMQS